MFLTTRKEEDTFTESFWALPEQAVRTNQEIETSTMGTRDEYYSDIPCSQESWNESGVISIHHTTGIDDGDVIPGLDQSEIIIPSNFEIIKM